MAKIGIMGGTFNPIHYGHLMIAEEVRLEFNLDKILFIPAANPPHKNNVIISPFHRYNMTMLATLSNPYFEVSDLELQNSAKPSYTYNTIQTLKKIYGVDTELFFIIGADCLSTLPNWYKFQELKSLVTFLVTKRPNYKYITDIPGLENIKIKYIQTPELEISSTDIRMRLAHNKNIRYLLPDEVIQYINKEKLYII